MSELPLEHEKLELWWLLELHGWDCWSEWCNNCPSAFWGGCSGIWRLWGLEAHIHIIKVIFDLQSHRIEALDLIGENWVIPELWWCLGRNGIYWALAKPLLGVVAWEKDLTEGQVGYFPNHLSGLNEDLSLKDPQVLWTSSQTGSWSWIKLLVTSRLGGSLKWEPNKWDSKPLCNPRG